MMRVVLVLAYLAAAAFTIVLADAHTENEQLEMVALALWVSPRSRWGGRPGSRSGLCSFSRS